MILLEKRRIFLLERMRPMMLFLPANILGNRRHARLANAEHPIPGLPCKFTQPFLAHPFGRIRLHHTRDFRGGMHGTNAHQHMNVISSPIDNQSDPIHLTNNPAKIRKQIFAKVGLNDGSAPVRREDEMQQHVAQCMRQPSSSLPDCTSHSVILASHALSAGDIRHLERRNRKSQPTLKPNDPFPSHSQPAVRARPRNASEAGRETP
jgi:hypothetical protein